MNPNRSAYMKSPWQFEIRDYPLTDPGPGQMLVKIGACAVCGTDIHSADRMCADWTAFGHEMSGVVAKIGEGMTRFKVGDRVALDSSAPCGKCEICSPAPYGKGRPDLCVSSTSYWNSVSMGFAQYILTPHEVAVHIPDDMSLEVASLVEPMGVSLDLCQVAGIVPGDRVLIIGAGPLGLGASVLAKRYGASRVVIADVSSGISRLKAGLALGADEAIEVDKNPLADYDFGPKKFDKILVTAPPPAIPDALKVAANGAVIAYLGIAWGPGNMVTFDADDFHFRKLQLRASFAGPATRALDAVTLLSDVPALGKELISHRFELENIEEAMNMARGPEKSSIVKLVMVNK